MLKYRLFAGILILLSAPLASIIVMAFVQNNGPGIDFSLSGFGELFTSLRLFEILTITKRAVFICLISTGFAFVISYALTVYTSRIFQAFFLIAITLPYLANEAIRVFSWQYILSENGIVNSSLSAMMGRPVVICSASNGWNIYFAMTVACIPFGIFICTAALRTMPSIYWIAANDLRVGPMVLVIKIIIPLSKIALLASMLVTFFIAFSLSAEVNHLGGDTKISTRNLILSLMSASRFQAIFSLGFFILCILFVAALVFRISDRRNSVKAIA